MMDDVDWVNIAEKAIYALIIIAVTWILAKVVKMAVAKLVTKVPALQKGGGEGASVGDSIGSIASLLIWLFGLVAVLQVFRLDAALDPVQGLLNQITAYLPRALGAGLVFFIGFLIAKIARQLVETSLGMVDFGAIAAKAQSVGPAGTADDAGAHAAEETGPIQPQPDAGNGQRIGTMVGNLVFAVIVIVVGIAALQILDISAVSDPAEEMLSLILAAIPSIIAAALILGIGYLIAKFIGPVLDGTLRGLGTDRAAADLGIVSEGKSISTVITRIAQIAILVFFAIAATRMLGFPEITEILNTVLALGGHVLFGAVIIAAGFLVATVAARALGKGTPATVIRWAIIVLFAAMGLKYMGIADSIITLAFGSVVIGGAVAAALAFGLGGRDAAARVLAEKQDAKAKEEAIKSDPLNG